MVVDGTWLRKYHHRHCPRCLHQTQDGKTVYFHAVLEAKLVMFGIPLSISLCSVPIENPGRAYNRQDCESKAFVRLTELLAELFPRLPICLVGDSLYACEPVIDLCVQRAWSYILVFKPGRTPALWEQAQRKWQRRKALCCQRPDGAEQLFRWATHLRHGEHVLHAIHCEETATDGTESTWAWITDLRPNRDTTPEIANQGGRLRDRIEQTFNLQKNGQFELRHDYGSHQRAWYNLYILVQVAHLLLQLICLTDLVKRTSGGAYSTFEEAFHTLRNFIRRMAESIQRDQPDPAWCRPEAPRIQIRFSSA